MATYETFFKNAWELIEGDGRAVYRVQFLSPAGTILDTWIPSEHWQDQQLEFEKRLSELKLESPKGATLNCQLQAIDVKGCVFKTLNVRIIGESVQPLAFGSESFPVQQARMVESLVKTMETVLSMANRQVEKSAEQWERIFNMHMETNEKLLAALAQQSLSVQKEIEKVQKDGSETREMFGMALEMLGPTVIEKLPTILSALGSSGSAKGAAAIVKG